MSKKSKSKLDAFHMHQALHMACVIMGMVDRELVQARAIKVSPEFRQLAEAAHENLFQLYQAIGDKHLD